MSVINDNYTKVNTFLNNKEEDDIDNAGKNLQDEEEILQNKEEYIKNKESILNQNISLHNNNIILSANVKPNKNVTYDLGSPSSRFKDIYLSGNTIHIDNAQIKSDDTIITFPSSVKMKDNFLLINDGIIIGNKYHSKYVFDEDNLLKSSNLSLSDSHKISNTSSSYQYIDTNNEYSKCYLSFSKDSTSEIIGCLTEDFSSTTYTPSSTDYYKGSGTYSFRIYQDKGDDVWEIYNNSSSVSYGPFNFTHSTENIYSIAYISDEIYFFINGRKEHKISNINNKKFKGRLVTSTNASNITTMINFNQITNVVNYYSDSLKTVNNTTSVQQYINNSTFLTIPYEGVWDISAKYFWKTAGGYIRKYVVLKKSDSDNSNTTNIVEKGSTSNYYAVNIGNGAYICDEIFVTVKCNSWDRITFHAASGLHISNYPLTITNIRMTATCNFFNTTDFF